MAIVAPERIEKLKTTLELLNQAGIKELKPKERNFVLSGFALGRYNDDIIYQICFNFGRDVIKEIESFLKNQEDERNKAI
jgi:hypothetical protein